MKKSFALVAAAFLLSATAVYAQANATGSTSNGGVTNGSTSNGGVSNGTPSGEGIGAGAITGGNTGSEGATSGGR
jgi:hypothetical protein